MKQALVSALACTLITLTACTPERRSPDAIREDTAKVTAQAARDANAVVQGISEGLKQKGPININKASADDLQTLPGIDADAASRIVDARPYGNSNELVKRHIITKAEYNRIATKVTTK